MTPNKSLLTALVGIIGLAIAVIATAANGEPPVARTAVLSAAAAKYPAFSRAQGANDVFRSRSAHPANQRAAVDIAQTSRRVFADDRGEAFVFLNNEDGVCVQWRPLDVDVAGSSCASVDSANPPGVLIGTDGAMNNVVLLEMIKPGVTGITVTQADGSTVDVPIADGVFVYQGRTPFVLHSQTTDGGEESRRVAPVGPPA